MVTDEGQCCSFNIMPDYLMMNHDVAEVGTESSEVNEYIAYEILLTNPTDQTRRRRTEELGRLEFAGRLS